MLFNSLPFMIFLPIVFILYWFVISKSLKNQNVLLLISSYFFYGWWDYRFLVLIAFSTLVDFLVAKRLVESNNQRSRKQWLFISLAINLGLLGFFKYYNFFVDSFATAFDIENTFGLNIILPVGISFYTFQTMSYTLDIYKRKMKPTSNFIEFAAFVSFFPQLVAGPIERASHLLPQFTKKKVFDSEKAIEGLFLIVYGLFKKVVIADTLAPLVNDVFLNYNTLSAGTLVLGAVFFSIQIYGDFSGYSDIAIGVSKLFGFDLMTNFNFPYFSKNISEFWRRWHISLSSWFKDYLYIPLGGSREGMFKSVRNVFIIFLVSGFWHGANWTFIIWGGIHAMLFLPSFIIKTNSNPLLKNTSFFVDLFKVLLTYSLVTLAWVFFRAESLQIAIDYLGNIVSNHNFSFNELLYKEKFFKYVIGFVIVDFIAFHSNKVPKQLKWVGIFIAMDLICLHALRSTSQEFIYFDF